MQQNRHAQESYNGAGSSQLEEFDSDSIILRRADPDDCDAIINLVQVGEDDIFNRVYAYPKILKLIETAYLAITVIDREGNVCAFAAFEDFPQGLRGMNDDKHFNFWEDWFRKAYKVEEFSAFNTLWLTYFIAGGIVGGDRQLYAFKQVLQTVYTSLPDLIGVLFLCRGDADTDDIEHCFGPICGPAEDPIFKKVPIQDPAALTTVRGIHRDSAIFYSSRIQVLPFIEVRPAKQEDHDDLADVFNSQSETVTEAYGEYFIAELIAAQNDRNKALVAQVKDKAVGLMGLTLDVDVKLLHKCFDLDSFDNLLKPEYMDAIRKRRELIKAQMQREEDNQRIEAMRELKKQTMLCNIIAQRIALQEYLSNSFQEICDQITKLHEEKSLEREQLEKQKQAADANKKFEQKPETHTKDFVIKEFFNKWLANFKLKQPSKYFLEHQLDDNELECNIQTELEFTISTLEFFGLPKGYMDLKGHHVDWDKQKDTGKGKAKGKGKQTAKKKGPAGPTNKAKDLVAKQKEKLAKDRRVEPQWFDLVPFKTALEKFMKANAERRSELRTTLIAQESLLRDCFRDENNDLSYKKIVDLRELKQKFEDQHININPEIKDDLEPILLCFGNIQFDEGWGDRVPPETPEEQNARRNLANREEKLKDLHAQNEKDAKAKKNVPKEEERKRAEEEVKLKEDIAAFKAIVFKPKKPQKMFLKLTSLHDLQQSIEKMAEFDRTLSEFGEIQFRDFEQEDFALKSAKRPYVRQLVKLPAIPADVKYSSNPVIQKKCEEIQDLTTIPDPPESAKNAFAITLFCMEAAFDSRSQDFLKYAFDLFPEREYLIVTQPHTVPENSLISKFTLAPKSAQNTFSHVLYLLHRDYLLEQDISITRTTADDFESIWQLIETNERANANETMTRIKTAVSKVDSGYMSFCARVYNTVVATFLISKDVNLEYLLSHFHIQDQILLNEHERRGHSRLVYSMINPIFQKSTRFMLKELLRLAGKTCLYFEIMDKTVIPTIFQELIHIRSRRFPHFLERKWDHERHDPKIDLGEDFDANIPVDGADRDPLDEKESPFALYFTTRRLLSEPKILKNARIVVVGASDAGISFVEALLSISYLNFSNITLVSPGGLPHHFALDKKSNLKASSTSYTNEELKKLMLESRINVVDARMTDIDRDDKNIILHDGKVLPYDTLILTMGIQEKALSSLKYSSQGIFPVPAGFHKCKGVLSIDDPFLYKFLAKDSPLMQQLTDHRRPTNCIVYGRTLHSYVMIQGLMHRGVKPSSIQLCIPRLECHVNEDHDPVIDEDMPYIYPDAFEDDHEIEQKIQNMLIDLGVTITRDTKLIEIITDKTDTKDEFSEDAQLEKVVFKRLDIPDEEEEEDEVNMSDDHSENSDGMSGRGSMNDGDNEDGEQRDEKQKKIKRKKNHMEMEGKVLITCCHRDVDEDVFKSIHDNGLVYNGRLIVDRNFQTTDPSIFAAGSLCEFSNRYKALAQGRSLRMDRYNGREIGSRLARSVFDIYDPNAAANAEQMEQVDELPLFYLPQGQGGVLPRGIIYYHIKTTNPMILKAGEQEKQNRDHLINDNLDCATGKGHFIKFTFNSIGLIDSVTYMSNEEIVLQSLWSFVGLHENYLNQLTSRHPAGIIPNVVEFLSENWAIGLYHEWFGDFCLRMRQGIQNSPDVYDILQKAQEKAIKERKGLSRDQIDQLARHLDARTVKAIQDETLEFIKTNMNHLPMYYVPGEEFA